MSSDWIDHLHAVRAEELQRILIRHRSCFSGKDLLELGSGSGFHLKVLSSVCRSAIGLEISNHSCKELEIPRIVQYDGKSIPFPKASFDVIFSSQVLQYLTHESQLYGEMRRVLRPGGVAVHVVPTAVWRFWTSVLHYPAKAQLLIRKLWRANASASEYVRTRQSSVPLRQVLANAAMLHRLGAKGNWLTEHFFFQAWVWRRRLGQNGWSVERIDPLRLWYTGHEIAGKHLSVTSRTALARLLGSPTATILATPVTDDR